MAQILIIDDHQSMREGLELLLRRRGHRTLSAENGVVGMDVLAESGAELVITDLKMARMDGLEVLRTARKRHPGVEVLVITAYGTIEKAVEAMKLGAADFLTKPFSSEEFGVKIDRLVRTMEERNRLRRENRSLRVENTLLREGIGSEGTPRYGEIVGESAVMQDVFRRIDRMARSDSTVMIYGESGTGKELVARAIHAGSERRGGPFVRVNCGALSESLLDSELFGHEKGAFTGAERRRQGRFELANRGTLFLDEVATVAPQTQIRLLRVLQERELERVGGEETIRVDVRIIAATNQSAETLLRGTGFREDLFYRLHVVPMTLPPLRKRQDDIPILAAHFVEKLRERTSSGVTSISGQALAYLGKHWWPGNVRELENVVEQALVMADGEVIEVSDLATLESHSSPMGDAAGTDLSPSGMDLNKVVEGVEERLLRKALEQARGVKAEAARLLGLKPSALYYKLEKYGIEA